ncbi:MAG: Crp/Fnr family transcriptional regulator [Cyclobacteriaceae bacterium]
MYSEPIERQVVNALEKVPVSPYATVKSGSISIENTNSFWNAYPSKSYKKNELIFRNGNGNKFVYFVSKGLVRVGTEAKDGKQILLFIRGRGDLFGALTPTTDCQGVFASAMEEGTEVFFVPAFEFQKLLISNSLLLRSYFEFLGSEIRKREQRIEDIMFKSARDRVIVFLRDLAEEKGRRVGFETVIDAHIKHEDIAGLTTTTRQTVTTVLNELKKAGLISIDRRRLLIRDLSKLK